MDNGLIFGSCEMKPCASREDAEEAALAGLCMIGRAAQPDSDYVPEADPERKLQIRVRGITYVVPDVTDHPHFHDVLAGGIKLEGTTFDGLMARFANLVLVEGAESHPVALAMLANCGWTYLTWQILEDFCVANGVDLEGNPEINIPAERSSHVLH